MRYMVLQGQTTGSRQKTVLSGFSCARRLTRLISVPTAQTLPGAPSAMAFAMNSVEPLQSAACTDVVAALRVDDDVDAGEPGARGGDLVDGEALVDGAVALPEDDCGSLELFQRHAAQAAVGLVVVPQRHRSSGTPIAAPVLRPRCWSGKKSTFSPRSKAHSSTAGALLEVQTMPPCLPQNAFSDAAEFM